MIAAKVKEETARRIKNVFIVWGQSGFCGSRRVGGEFIRPGVTSLDPGVGGGGSGAKFRKEVNPGRMKERATGNQGSGHYGGKLKGQKVKKR